MEDKLQDPAIVYKMARFVKASMKCWAWARENPKEAALIVLDNDATGAQTEKHQVRMMEEINKLTEGSDGALIPADYERTVQTMPSGGSDPVITKEPEGAWTHAVPDKALGLSGLGGRSRTGRPPSIARTTGVAGRKGEVRGG